MFHIVLAIASRFLYFGNALQGFARGILALRNLGVISSHLIPAISPPPPIALLDAPVHVPIVDFQRRSFRLTPPRASSPLNVSDTIHERCQVKKYYQVRQIRRSSAPWVIGPIIAILQWCGLLAAQDTRTPLINAIYEQITRGAAGYDDLVDCGDITYDHVEGQVVADGLLRNPDLAHDEIPEEYRLRLQKIYNQFVDSQNFFREQLDRSRAQQQELHAELLAAERERERLESNRQGAKARCAEAEEIASKLRVDLSAAMEHLDRQTGGCVEQRRHNPICHREVAGGACQAQVRRRQDYAPERQTAKRTDRRHRKTKELLDEQVRAQDRHESEIRRLKQEAQDAQEAAYPPYRDHWVALEKLFRGCARENATLASLHFPRNTSMTPMARHHPAANVDSVSSPLSTKRDHWVALEELFGWMRQEEYESAQDAVKPNENRRARAACKTN
ncbi:hypothetical protein BGY98DRAFT_1181844 [Russula aff. rugulosa BPL654]|nr:hypothetical protein BGY98DRAFT_1181844 [Russula aff. rugulosa BPL654]